MDNTAPVFYNNLIGLFGERTRQKRRGGKSVKVIWFDVCAIPLFVMILAICFSRKMTRGNANQLFILVVMVSLLSAAADLGMEIPDNMVPLSRTGYLICTVSSYLYLALRNANNAVLLLFLLALTRTTSLMKRKKWIRVAFCLPYAVILILLLQNPFTHNVFTVTPETGYARGPLLMAFYGVAMIYGLVGLIYCIYCRRYLPHNKWVALLCCYVLAHLAVVIQFFRPELLVEMYFTALGEMLITLSIMRPEERMDSEVGMLSWASYQSDLRNVILAGDHVQIIVVRLQNCVEIRNYLGDYSYNRYLTEIAKGIRAMRWNHPRHIELYFERPGTIYLLADEDEAIGENIAERMVKETGDQVRRYAEMGVRFEPRVCLIRCPEDLQKEEEIISLGHKFQKIDTRKQTVYRAAEIVHSQTFAIEAHIEEIFDRAIKNNNLEMVYQPIYDVQSGSFHSAEALARIYDPEYGPISPAIFIPAAETEGFIVPIGDAVLDHVFRFLSEHDPDSLGLSSVDVNLSVAQCMERSLPEKMRALQEKYGVDPTRIVLEITETTFENISDVVLENVTELIHMGYSFALDDYGIGYSSIQRVNHLPLKLIKIDKSMLDEVYSADGRKILEYTVRMMQSIGKQLVVEGAETGGEVDILKEMNCDYIQGFYYSRPLPVGEFLCFMEKQNHR